MEHYWGYNIGKNTPSKQNATCSSWPKMWPSDVNIFFSWTQYDDILHVKDRDRVKLFIVNSVKFVYGVAGVIYAYPCRVGEASDPHCLFSTLQRFLCYILCFGLCLFQGGRGKFCPTFDRASWFTSRWQNNVLKTKMHLKRDWNIKE